jgi:hypothetical protein
MESDRKECAVKAGSLKDREAGITVIGFLLLAVVFGMIGFAIIKIVPLYMQRMRVQTVLEDLKSEVGGGSDTSTATSIRLALEQRLYVENLKIPREEIAIAREGEGWLVRITHEARASFIADLSFVVDIDEQVEIAR